MNWADKSESIIEAFIHKYGYCRDFIVRLMTLSSLQEKYNENPEEFIHTSNERWVNLLYEKGQSAGLLK